MVLKQTLKLQMRSQPVNPQNQSELFTGRTDLNAAATDSDSELFRKTLMLKCKD